jgi:hypothetical protein
LKKISFNLLGEEIGASSDLHFIMNIFLMLSNKLQIVDTCQKYSSTSLLMKALIIDFNNENWVYFYQVFILNIV